MNAQVAEFLENIGYKLQEVRSIDLYTNFHPDGDRLAQAEADFTRQGVETTPVAPKYIQRDIVVLETIDGKVFIFSPSSWDTDHVAVPVYIPERRFTDEMLDMEGVFAAVDRSYPCPLRG